jgi:hypothetical protein
MARAEEVIELENLLQSECRLLARNCQSWSGRACPLCPGNSDINLFRYG